MQLIKNKIKIKTPKINLDNLNQSKYETLDLDVYNQESKNNIIYVIEFFDNNNRLICTIDFKPYTGQILLICVYNEKNFRCGLATQMLMYVITETKIHGVKDIFVKTMSKNNFWENVFEKSFKCQKNLNSFEYKMNISNIEIVFV